MADNASGQDRTVYQYPGKARAGNTARGEPWKVLLVDDEPDVHNIITLILRDFSFDERPVEILKAKSATHARKLLAAHPQIAVAIVDVVMETEHAGLELVRHIRHDLGNQAMRIILHTGQPGLAPEHEIIYAYEINDYRTKGELTEQRFLTCFVTALRSYRDICELVDARDQKARTEGESRARSEFLALLNHALRAPLRELLLRGRLLVHNLEGTRDDQRQAERIVELGRQVLEANRHILEAAGTGDIEEELNYMRFDVRGLLREVVALLDSRARERRLRLRTQVMDRVPAILCGDPGRLRQLLLSVTANAIRSAGKGTEVRLLVSTAGISENHALLEFSVNGGNGMCPDCDEPVPGTAHAGEPGKYIEFEVCRELSELMGGSLVQAPAADSTACTRLTTLFDLPVPCGELDPAFRVDAAFGPRDLRHRRILLVDDNPVARRVSHVMLERLGLTHDLAGNGREALERLRNRRYDLVLMDCNMPVMNGFEATRAIRGMQDLQDLRIIALAPTALPPQQAACRDAGMDDILLKPFSLAELRQKLHA